MRDDRPLPEPNQLWVIEQVPAQALSVLDRDAVARANVVIYDRSLAGIVAEALAPGGYAEPLSHPCEEAGRALSARAVQFAADGWSVVQLVEASPCWRARLSQASGELSPLGAAGVRLIAKHGEERYSEVAGDLAGISRLAGDSAGEPPMTVIF